MPMVAEAVRRRYDGVRITVHDPMHAVVNGAAIYAGRNTNDVKVNGILTKTYGIKVRTGGKESVVNILHRNSRIPYESRRVFHPEAKGQPFAVVEIYENSADRDETHSEIADSQRVGSFNIRLPVGCDRSTKVTVRLVAASDGTISVKAMCGNNAGSCVITAGAASADGPVGITESEEIGPSAPVR